MESTVSPRIDDLTNSMNFYGEKRLSIWKKYLIFAWEKFSDVNMNWRESGEWFEREGSLPSCICGHFMTIFGCDACKRKRRVVDHQR